MSATRKIENIYPLSPVQKGLLFHALQAAEGQAYFRQAEYELRGDLQVEPLRLAWQAAIDRHSVLRTGFNWQSREEPFQVVYRSVPLAWREEDWRGLPPQERSERYSHFLAADARKGFDLTRPPLLRLALIRCSDTTWRLIATSHLLLLDGWSQPLLFAEVAAHYRRLTRGTGRPLAPAPPFADYVAWVRGQDTAQAAAFWRRMFAGFTALPAPREPQRSSVSEKPRIVRELDVPGSVALRLRAFARQQQVTLSTLTQGAWALLLRLLDGEDDLVFGVTVSGRPAEISHIESMIGLFINTLPLRLQVAADRDPVAWLREIQNLHAELRQFEHVSLVDVQGWSGVPRSQPLFDSVLVFENFPMKLSADAAESGFEFEIVRSVVHTNYPLVLTVWPEPVLRLRLTADADRFDSLAVERLIHRLPTLLSGLAGEAGARLGALPVLTEAETHQLLFEWNPAEEGDAREISVHELVKERARRYPERIAAEVAGASLSYGELDQAANRLAHRLRRLGVSPEVKVGVHLERSLELVVALLGILKAGGAYVPLDVGYPDERLAFVAADAGIAVLLARREEGRKWGTDLPVIALDRLGRALQGESSEDPSLVASGENLAYVMYTSGSTGRPKGVSIPHRAIVWHLATLGYAELGESDRVAQASTASFDAATFEIWGALSAGALLVGIPPEVVVSPQDLAARLAQDAITVLYLTAALFSQTARQLPSALAGLRCVLSSGEAADVAAYRLVLQNGAPRRLLHLYGPTETTVFSSWERIAEVEEGCSNLTIGRPIARSQSYLLDGELMPVPAGGAGELYIGGEGLARGYLNRPELTAASFVPDRYGREPGSRLYRTGDWVRHLQDGRLEFLGRRDEQVKLRGIRIELGEIQAALSRHSDIDESLVLVREGEPGDRRLVAYLVPRTGAAPSPEALRLFLRSSLPEAMVPAAFVQLAAFPLSANGKIDRRALLALEPETEKAGPDGVPRSALERELAAVWGALLGVEGGGVHDDFFALGGHSLLAMQLISRVRRIFGVDLPLRQLMEYPTIEAMARAIESLGRSGETLPVPPLVALPRPERVPLSYAQQRLWLIDQLDPRSGLYNIGVALRVDGPLDRQALAAALCEVVRRHEALRTVFGDSDGEPFQVVCAAGSGAPLSLIDLGALSREDREREGLRVAAEEVRQGFDLTRGPLLRFRLLALGAEEHLALLVLHHIVGDGWSMGVLIDELTTLYGAFRDGRLSPLPELPVQYADFALWQRAWLDGEVLARQLGYWRCYLAGSPASLELPLDRPRPARSRHRGARRDLLLSGELVARLRELAERESVTMFMALLALCQALLGRSAGQPDVVVGIPIAGRHHAGLEPLIGFFVNTLVIRADLGDDPDLRQLLSRVRESALGAYAHQDLPFEKLVEDLAVERVLNRHPLFQVLFAYQNDVVEEEDVREIAGLRLSPVAGGEARMAKFDLSFALRPRAGGLGCGVEYDRDLFDAASIDRLLRSFHLLLTSAVSNSACRLSDLPLLAPEERHQLAMEWGMGQEEAWQAGTVVDRLEAQAAATPQALALIASDARLTLAELNARANRVAHALLRRGFGLGARIGLLTLRSPAMVAGLLGILKAGAAYIPLDPSYPEARISYLLGDSEAVLVLSEESVPAGLVQVPVAILLVEEILAPAPRVEELANPPRQAGPGDLAYLLHTSGTTGTPKAVMVEHWSLMNTLDAARSQFGFGPGDRMPCIASFAFDIFLFELLGPLLAGGTALLMSLEPTLDLKELARELATATRFHAVPAVMRQVVDLLREEDALCPHVRDVFVGGDAVPDQLLADLRRPFPAARIRVLYGPTEGTIFCSTYTVPEGLAAPRALIGRPIAGAAIQLLDRHGNPTPIGVPGEISIGGRAVTRGYLNRPELTAEKYSAAGGQRFYRSGDIARYLPDGNLQFLGRGDRQVKVRGFRIELAEVEAALSQSPLLREAVVLVRPDATGDPRLVAYGVPRSPAAVDPAELRSFLEERLPGYMVPSVFLVLASLPLTAHGKVDRKALPAPEPLAPAPEVCRTPFEEVISGIFGELLAVPAPGPHGNFFELGGHSLKATQLVSRLRSTFGIELPLKGVFEAPTVSALAERVEAALGASRERTSPLLLRVPRSHDLPLSFAQQRLWFIEQLTPERTVYHLPIALRVQGLLAPSVLAATFAEIERRHEVLRTTFATVGEAPVQRIQPPSPFTLPTVDLAGLPAVERERLALRLAEEDARRPFDLVRGPLWRATLLRLGPAEHLALVPLHHVVSDGWSSGVLVRELTALYGAFSAGQPSPLPELPIQYADFAVWQRWWLSGEVLTRLLGYWRQTLAGVPPLELPADRLRPAVASQCGDFLPFVLAESVESALAAFGREQGASLFMVLLAALEVLLSRWSGQEDFALGSPVANRSQAELEGLIGFFVNTLVLRSQLAGAPDFRSFLGRVREGALDAYAHQDLPFERVVEELQPERDLSRSPLFQIMLALQQHPNGEELRLPGLVLTQVPLASAGAMFDLSLGLRSGPQGLVGRLEYAVDLFDRSTVARLLSHFETLLAGIVAEPGRSIWDLALMSAAERRQVLLDWNETGPARLTGFCLHELFEAQAARTPEVTALVVGARRFTYRELDVWSSRLAHRLRGLGVGPEVRVGLLVERSARMVAAMLGVLKAGGAYIGLDPRSPKDRLAGMLADASAALLLTETSMLPLLPEEGPEVVYLDGDESLKGGGAEESVLAEGDSSGGPRTVGSAVPRNLAFLIYTSGSTGRPKGVAIEHASAAALVGWAQEVFSGEALAGVLASTAISFDLSVFEIFVPLSCGGAVILAEDALSLPTLAAAEEVTLINTVPSAIAGLVRLGALPPRAATINLAGEALKRELVEEIYRQPGVRRVLNLYGPSEDSTYSTWTLVPAGSPRPPAIGRPIAGTRAYLLDARLAPTPLGALGELYLAGAGLARGYLGRPDLTALRFLPDPFSRAGGERLYRTGDLARYRLDGDLDYLGRIDGQIKLRGFRIEPGEIEAALTQHPSVAEAIVLARRDDLGDLRLVAYAVPGLEPPAPSDLRSFLEERLPAYMVPAAFVLLDRLPLNAHGKIDKGALPLPGSGQTDPQPVASRKPVEEILAGVFGQLLRIPTPVAGGHFFELGGHSLKATQLISRVRETFGVELPLKTVFEAPTVSALAERIETALRSGGASTAPPLLRTERKGCLPLSFTQRRLWFIEQLDPGNEAYQIPMAVRLAGQLVLPVLAASLSEVVRRHEILRTRFVEIAEGVPSQVIAPPEPIRLPVVDVSGLPSVEAEVRRLAAAQVQVPFDLSRGPLLRYLLLCCAPGEHVALFAMHHIISDAWSMGVLLQELQTLYAAFLDGGPSPLPELALQYVDVAAWQQRWLQGRVLEEHLAYWRRQLSGELGVLELPLDSPRPALPGYRGSSFRFTVPRDLYEAALTLGRAEGATLFMTLLAGFKALLYRYTGQTDLLVGTVIANRERGEMEKLIGCFVNTLVLRTKLSPWLTFRELLQRVRDTALGAYAHQDLPFERLVEDLMPKRDLARFPLFQVRFELDNTPVSRLELPGLELSPVPVGLETSKFDLTLSMRESEGDLLGDLTYRRELFEEATIRKLAARYLALLGAACMEPATRLGNLEMFSPDEKERRAKSLTDSRARFRAARTKVNDRQGQTR